MTTGRTLVTHARFHEWVVESPPLLTLHGTEFDVMVLEDGYDGPGGYTLCWSSAVEDVRYESAEWYSDLPTALARLAVLQRCLEGPTASFRDQAEGFVRWSENFFERTVLTAPASKPAE